MKTKQALNLNCMVCFAENGLVNEETNSRCSFCISVCSASQRVSAQSVRIS